MTAPHARHRPRRRPPLAAALLIATLGAGAAEAEAARIYRMVDEHGNVVFTDVPPKSGEHGEAVDLSRGNTYRAPPASEPGPSRSLESWLGEDGAGDGGEAAVTRYSTLAVASPGHDEAIRNNAGNVAVVAAVEPELQEGHVMQLYLDGELRQSSRTPAFQLTNLDRGTHSVELRIVDASGQTLARSEPSVFHLQRRSVILQPPAGRRPS